MKKIEWTLRIAMCGEFLGHGVFAYQAAPHFRLLMMGSLGIAEETAATGSPRDRDHRFYDRRSGLGQTDTSRTAVGGRWGASDGTGTPCFRQGDLGFCGTLVQLGRSSGVAVCSRDSSQRERLAAVEESGPRAAAGRSLALAAQWRELRKCASARNWASAGLRLRRLLRAIGALRRAE